MYIPNTTILKKELLYCSKKLGRYLISRNIPQLSIDGEKFVFSKTDILEEILSMLPTGLRKERYEYK